MRRPMKRLLSLLSSLSLLLVFFCAVCAVCAQGAAADESLNKAIALYNAGNYKAASRALYQVSSTQQTATATYYLALSYEKLNFHAQALDLFKRIVTLWPGSEEARLAGDYVQKMDEIAAADKEKADAEARLSPAQRARREFFKPLTRAQWDALPSKVRFPIARERGHLMVTAKVNGKYCKMAFDTGATCCSISLVDYPDVLSRAQLDSAKQVPVGRPHGVMMQKVAEAEISVNDLTRTVRILGSSEPQVSVIGQNFFKEYTYQVDDFYVRLTKSPYSPDDVMVAAKPAPETNTRELNNSLVSAAAATKKKADRYTIPFEKDKDCMLIDIEINGFKTKAIFDTGCAPEGMVCHPALAEKAHLRFPTMSGNRADRVVVGSIIKMDVPVYYAGGLQYPLLGPKFFGRPFTVDQTDKCIRFDW